VKIYLTASRAESDNHPLMKSEQKKRMLENGRGPTIQAKTKLSGFARRLLAEWKRLALPLRDEPVVVAVSGGADSVALLLALDELSKAGQLKLALTVAHLDHGLRGEAGREDARWVKALAEELGLAIQSGRAAVKKLATSCRDNLEQAARRARYEFLMEVAESYDARIVLTGHTMNDQAETVLLRLLRGSGVDGLGGIKPVRELIKSSGISLARPLLRWAQRAETLEYCQKRGVQFRTDEMNEDERFSRVRVRRQLLPLMETFNPRAVVAVARMAELLREVAEVVETAAKELLKAASVAEKVAEDERSASVIAPLSVNILAAAPAAIRRRALRLWIAQGRGDLRRLELVHLSGVEKLLEGERGRRRRAELPGGSFVERRGGHLLLFIK
jgi:tRNA(Ile)-lysidine synthase